MEKDRGYTYKTPVPRLLMNLGCRKRYQMLWQSTISLKYDIRIIGFVIFMYINEIFKNMTEKMEQLKG